MAFVTLAPDPTPTSSADETSYTETFKDNINDYKPIENLQIGPGHNEKLTAYDIPIILSALYSRLSDRLWDMVYSSDEVSLRR